MSGRSRARIAVLLERIARLERPLLLAFDVDGTLAPIVDDPAGARVPAATRAALHALSGMPEVRVALVTGRDAASLARVAKVPGAYRALEHGKLVLAPGERDRAPGLTLEERARLEAFAAWARAHAVPHGARLERKPRSYGLHVREAARADAVHARRMLAGAARVARRHGLVWRTGRGLLEAELWSADKGTALATLAARAGARGIVYVGDDVTDTPAIVRARALGGVGIFVRSDERPRAPRGASATLASLREVAWLIAVLARELPRPPRITPGARPGGARRARRSAPRQGPSRRSR